MSAKDIYHDTFVRALQKDGWTITHDPLTVTVEDTKVMVDIGAERVVAAERDGERSLSKSSRLSVSPQYRI